MNELYWNGLNFSNSALPDDNPVQKAEYVDKKEVWINGRNLLKQTKYLRQYKQHRKCQLMWYTAHIKVYFYNPN